MNNRIEGAIYGASVVGAVAVATNPGAQDALREALNAQPIVRTAESMGLPRPTSFDLFDVKVAVAAPLEADPMVAVDSPEAAAAKYGADAWTSNPANWEVKKPNPQPDGSGKDTYAHLKTDPSGINHIVNVDGAVVEESIDLHASEDGIHDGVPGDGKAPEVRVILGAGVPQHRAYIRGGTFRVFAPEASAQEAVNLYNKVTAKEMVEQGNVVILPVGFNPNVPCN